jgi:hypothetical protein
MHDRTQTQKKPKEIFDVRMLELIDILKQRGDIRYTKDFCEAIGFSRLNIQNVRNGHQSFTAFNILHACETYNVNANWLYGRSDKVFMDAAMVMKNPAKKSLV